MKTENIAEHPCFNKNRDWLSHRSGGIGGTCERCGTEIDSTSGKNLQIGPTRWEPIVEPLPFQPGSLERELFIVLNRTTINKDDCAAQVSIIVRFLKDKEIVQ